MNILKDLLNNYVLVVAVSSWFTAQVLKTIINFIMTKELKLERMFGAGGMPSAHSASVCGLTMAVARALGVSSVEFGMTFLLAMVVMYDATGVRRAAGKNARAINLMMQKNNDIKEKIVLKESLGHTPLEVVAGALLGIIIAFIIPM